MRKTSITIVGGTRTEAISSDVEDPLTIRTSYELAMPILLGEVSEQILAEKAAFALEQLLKESMIHLPQKRQDHLHQEFRNVRSRG